jgi:hypothetical protein
VLQQLEDAISALDSKVLATEKLTTPRSAIKMSETQFFKHTDKKNVVQGGTQTSPGPILNDELHAQAVKAFNFADKDGSGTIDHFELYNLLQQILPNITLPESNAMYAQMDQNRSGLITVDEFTSGIQKFKLNAADVAKK